MKIIKVKGFEGTEFERHALTVKIINVIETAGSWIKVYYKVPRGRKVYSMFLQKGDIA